MEFTTEVALKALAALISLGFGAVVVATGPSRRANWFLGAFLFLIAGNQTAEVVVAASRGDATAIATWFRVATVFAALDPFALYYFASIHPVRNDLNRPRRVALVGGVSLLFVALAFVADANFAYFAGPREETLMAALASLGLATFTALVYSFLAVRALRSMLAGGGGGSEYLAPALVIVAFPVWRTAVGYAQSTAAILASRPALLSAEAFVTIPIIAAAVVTIAVVGHTIRRARTPTRHARMRAWLAAGFVLALLAVLLAEAIASSRGLAPPPGWGLGRAGAALRWLAFGALVSLAVLRDGMLGVRPGARRVAARVLLGLTTLGAGAAVMAVVQGEGELSVRPLDWVILALVVLASQSFRTLVDRAAYALYRVPMPMDPATGHATYRDAVTRAIAQGRRPDADAELRALRAELSLDEPTARGLERLAEATLAGPLMPGRLVVGRYRIIQPLGRGSGGRALLAHDETLSRNVVLKEILVDDEESERAALREAKLAASIRHPRVVVLHDVLRGPGAIVLAWEHMAGGTLAQRGPLPPREARRVVLAVAEGLAALHEAGIVHRDLKPENVLFDEDGEAKVADLGVALPQGGTIGLQASPGTPRFMAPEQLRGEPATMASDVYALGLLARQSGAGSLGAGFDAAIEKALDPVPEARFTDASAMLAALRRAEDEERAA